MMMNHKMSYVMRKLPVHPRRLISAFIVRCVDSIIHILAKSKLSRLKLVSVAGQAGSSLTWSQNPEDEARMSLFKMVPRINILF